MLKSMYGPFLVLTAVLSLVSSVRAACPLGDVYEDCEVNWYDLKFLCDRWLEPAGSEADIVGGNGVNLGDFALVIDHWLETGSATGVLQVNILPEDANDGWSVDGGVWQSSGNMLTLSVGFHQLEYKAIDGWTEPNVVTVHIRQGKTTAATGAYVRQSGSISVTISPDSAVKLGAQWRIEGDAWRQSDETVSGLPPGACVAAER